MRIKLVVVPDNQLVGLLHHVGQGPQARYERWACDVPAEVVTWYRHGEAVQLIPRKVETRGLRIDGEQLAARDSVEDSSELLRVVYQLTWNHLDLQSLGGNFHCVFHPRKDWLSHAHLLRK